MPYFHGMKNMVPVALLFAGALVWSSCARQTYPQPHAVRKAYGQRLKSMADGYRRFTPAPLPPDSLEGRRWVAPSPNFDIRTPDMVIIHQTEEAGCAQSLHTLTNPSTNRRVSAHYLICKDGTVFQLVDERYRAWQAGISRWGHIRNVNSVSLGIELDNTGREPFPPAQIRSLLTVLGSIRERYHIPAGNFVGHADIAPTRKQDPSVYFPWDTLARHGFGFWPDTVLAPVPSGFDALRALRLIGYDISDSAAAIVSFKRHFIRSDLQPVLDDSARKVLYNLSWKYAR